MLATKTRLRRMRQVPPTSVSSCQYVSSNAQDPTQVGEGEILNFLADVTNSTTTTIETTVTWSVAGVEVASENVSLSPSGTTEVSVQDVSWSHIFNRVGSGTWAVESRAGATGASCGDLTVLEPDNGGGDNGGGDNGDNGTVGNIQAMGCGGASASGGSVTATVDLHNGTGSRAGADATLFLDGVAVATERVEVDANPGTVDITWTGINGQGSASVGVEVAQIGESLGSLQVQCGTVSFGDGGNGGGNGNGGNGGNGGADDGDGLPVHPAVILAALVLLGAAAWAASR